MVCKGGYESKCVFIVILCVVRIEFYKKQLNNYDVYDDKYGHDWKNRITFLSNRKLRKS